MQFAVGSLELSQERGAGITCRVQGCEFPELPNGQHLCYCHSRAAQKLLTTLTIHEAKKAAKDGLYYVYFVQHSKDGPIKIGTTRKDPAKRLIELQIGTPEELTMLAFMAGEWWLEKALHKALEAHNVRGEWFRDCPELRLIIALVKDGQGDKVHAFAKNEGEIKYKKRRSNLARKNASDLEHFMRPVVDEWTGFIGKSATHR